MKGDYKQVIAQLEAHGYHFLRAGKGSYEAWSNGTHLQTVSRNISSRHMANAIMKQAGIAYRF